MIKIGEFFLHCLELDKLIFFQWKAAKEELHAEEKDEPESAYEILERKRQRGIEVKPSCICRDLSHLHASVWKFYCLFFSGRNGMQSRLRVERLRRMLIFSLLVVTGMTF